MLAIRVHHPGGPDVLQLEDVPTPVPGRREALVRLDASGVNFVDVYQRSGLYPMAMPFTPGQEGAGVVVTVGDEVTLIRPGDRVAFTGVQGAYAEQVAVPADRLVVLPDGVTTREGAAIMLQGMTAHYLAISTYPLAEGDWCIVHAAAGGVGLLLTQIARRRGAHGIATAGTPEKLELARQAGAEVLVNYTHENVTERAREATGGAGVRVAYDSVGRSTWEQSLSALAPRGMLVLFGNASGPVPPIDPLLLMRKGSLYVTRPTLGNYIATRDELAWRAGELFAWLRDGTLSLRIGREYPLRDAAEAQRALEARETTGKVLLIP